MNKRSGQIMFHVLGCICFLTIPILFSPDFGSLSNLFKVPPFQRDFLAYVLLVAYFYFNYYVIVPSFYFNKKFTWFIACTLLGYMLVSFIPYLLINQDYEPVPVSGLPSMIQQRMFVPYRGSAFRQFFFHELNQHFPQFVIVFSFSLLMRIRDRWRIAEKEKVDVELSYLKAQINPHFLFNTLNSIYSMAIEKSDNTPEAVVKLSAMMRYVLSEANKDFVPLEKEIAYLQSYIALQRFRFGGSVKLSFDIFGSPDGYRIPPLILIPFVENAFKHGVNAEEDSEIFVEINIKENNLSLFVGNRKVKVHITEEEKSGIGINNVRNRLNLLYPGRHTLLIDDTNTHYVMRLNLTLS
ncbi:MAG: sensor histidine kinase [Bacteroidetes bacterium]|nr:sensor histidine kinase [Bacteroidota bacterium]